MIWNISGNAELQLGRIRVKGNERILAPVGQTWDSFFLGLQTVTDDFMEERDAGEQPEREAL